MRPLIGAAVAGLSALLSACDPPVDRTTVGGEEGEGEGEGKGEGEGATGLDVDVGIDDFPCDFPEAWPIALPSSTRAVVVHIRDESERAVGEAFLADLEDAWGQELALGFPEPPGDAGLCGDDDRFDAFLFRNSDNAYVDLIDTIPETPSADVIPYMVLDWEVWPDAIPAHELNHAMQASCDWGETAFIYEATSQFIEEKLFDADDTVREVLVDYQGRSDLAIDHDDGYEGYYMYGAALYLLYLDEAVFADDPTWIGRMWIGARSTELADFTSADPDVEDVLDDMIGEARSMSFFDSVVEFARWRYYMGSKDDGAHWSEAGEVGEDARVVETRLATGDEIDIDVSELGTIYLTLSGDGDVTIDVGGDALDGGLDGAVLVAQALPGSSAGSDGDGIPGTTTLTVPVVAGARTLALTLLPPEARADPDLGERPRRTLHLSAR